MKTTSLGLLAFIALGGSTGQTLTDAHGHKAPPSNATPVGKMSSPKAGTQTIPIHDVEVYKFTAAIDDAELYWAYDGEVVYVWGAIELEDEAASGIVVLEADDFGYGWLISTSCSTLHGCSADRA